MNLSRCEHKGASNIGYCSLNVPQWLCSGMDWLYDGWHYWLMRGSWLEAVMEAGSACARRLYSVKCLFLSTSDTPDWATYLSWLIIVDGLSYNVIFRHHFSWFTKGLNLKQFVWRVCCMMSIHFYFYFSEKYEKFGMIISCKVLAWVNLPTGAEDATYLYQPLGRLINWFWLARISQSINWIFCRT